MPNLGNRIPDNPNCILCSANELKSAKRQPDAQDIILLISRIVNAFRRLPDGAKDKRWQFCNLFNLPAENQKVISPGDIIRRQADRSWRQKAKTDNKKCIWQRANCRWTVSLEHITKQKIPSLVFRQGRREGLWCWHLSCFPWSAVRRDGVRGNENRIFFGFSVILIAVKVFQTIDYFLIIINIFVWFCYNIL